VTQKDSSLFSFLDDSRDDQKLAPAVLAAALSACATETVLLNSERVEQRFGNYGIDVLASEAGLRRSSLYSAEDDSRICRTYAVVRFTDEPDQSFGAEHTKVLAGNSLGEVFKAEGWSIHKQTLHIGSLVVDDKRSGIGELMQLSDVRNLALHVYQLLLVRPEQVFEYATIIEAHHPDYLLESDLLETYRYGNSDALSDADLADVATLIINTAAD
jgi:hypothetical protein